MLSLPPPQMEFDSSRFLNMELATTSLSLSRFSVVDCLFSAGSVLFLQSSESSAASLRADLESLSFLRVDFTTGSLVLSAPRLVSWDSRDAIFNFGKLDAGG